MIHISGQAALVANGESAEAPNSLKAFNSRSLFHCGWPRTCGLGNLLNSRLPCHHRRMTSPRSYRRAAHIVRALPGVVDRADETIRQIAPLVHHVDFGIMRCPSHSGGCPKMCLSM
jgi:hypothetical protein